MLFANDDLRRLASGAALACAAGLLMGAAFQPNLDEHDAAGPQMLMGESGARRVFAAADPGFAMYEGRLPDHVIGTDWVRSQQPPRYAPETPERAEVVVYEDEAPPEPVEMARAAWIEEPRAAVGYPSMDGNDVYEADLPPAPAPPSALDELDAG